MTNINSDLTLGEKVRRLRLSKGWTQEQLGNRANLSQAGIARIERGECQQTRKIVSLSNALGVRPEELDSYDKDVELKKKNTNHLSRFSMLRKQFPDWQDIISNVCNEAEHLGYY